MNDSFPFPAGLTFLGAPKCLASLASSLPSPPTHTPQLSSPQKLCVWKAADGGASEPLPQPTDSRPRLWPLLAGQGCWVDADLIGAQGCCSIQSDLTLDPRHHDQATTLWPEFSHSYTKKFGLMSPSYLLQSFGELRILPKPWVSPLEKPIQLISKRTQASAFYRWSPGWLILTPLS